MLKNGTKPFIKTTNINNWRWKTEKLTQFWIFISYSFGDINSFKKKKKTLI